MKKANLYIAYVATSDRTVRFKIGKEICQYEIPVGEVTFGVKFDGYRTRRFFYGVCTSVVDPNRSVPRYIKVALNDCNFSPLDHSYSLYIDDRVNFEDDPRVKLLSETEAANIAAIVSNI